MWIVAHRGASLAAQENTLEAFRLARDEGADAIELDVQPTRDGQLVVFHDWETDRLAGEAGTIRGRTLDEVRRLRSGGLAIPTLEEVVLAASERPEGLIVELKSGGWNDVLVAGLAARVLRRTKALDLGRLVVSSFNPICLLTLRRIAPELPRGLLAHGKLGLPFRRLWSRRIVGASQLHLEGRMQREQRLVQLRSERGRQGVFFRAGHAGTRDDESDRRHRAKPVPDYNLGCMDAAHHRLLVSCARRASRGRAQAASPTAP